MKTKTNNFERENMNRVELCKYMEQLQAMGDLSRLYLPNSGDVYCASTDDGDYVIDISTGAWLFTKKSNKRSYKKMPLPNNSKYMLANYSFRVIIEGLIGDEEQFNRYLRYRDGMRVYREYTKEECLEKGFDPNEHTMGPCVDKCVINHINGDTEDNSDKNLEVDTIGMNNVHARLMAEVHHYYPELIIEEFDCQGHAMHRWADGVGISCEQIRKWNSMVEVSPS